MKSRAPAPRWTAPVACPPGLCSPHVRRGQFDLSGPASNCRAAWCSRAGNGPGHAERDRLQLVAGRARAGCARLGRIGAGATGRPSLPKPSEPCARILAVIPTTPGPINSSANSRSAASTSRKWWAGHRVATASAGSVRLRHPVVGDLELNFEDLALREDPDQVLRVYSAKPSSPSADSLTLLGSFGAGPRARHGKSAVNSKHGRTDSPTTKRIIVMKTIIPTVAMPTSPAIWLTRYSAPSR